MFVYVRSNQEMLLDVYHRVCPTCTYSRGCCTCMESGDVVGHVYHVCSQQEAYMAEDAAVHEAYYTQ